MSTPYFKDEQIELWHGDSLAVLREMPDQSVDCCVTSPPYFGLRDYGVEGQYGLESSPAEYVETMRALFAEVRRVLADDGTLWLNIGDSYNNFRVSQRGQSLHKLEQRAKPEGRRPADHGLKEKDLMGIPWRVAFALQSDGWFLRNDIIWSKPNGMPESVRDRLSTKHEHVFMFSKSQSYWFNLDPIRERYDGERSESRRARTPREDWKENSAKGAWDGKTEGRNPGDVWSIPTQPFPAAHFAVMPLALAERCVLAGCHEEGVVLDPFSGSGTVGLAATKHWREYVGIDLSSEYLDLSLRTRFADKGLDFSGGAA